MNRVLFKSDNVHWQTPDDLYTALHAEFAFTLDPCPNGATDGLTRPWTGQRVYCNPPYGRGVALWLAKAPEADLAVFLLPARTDTNWWHEYTPRAHQIRFLRGRLKFKGAKQGAPFPSVVIIFKSQGA
jgi:site-specific DNA-methyltransferase (adenine-specific)